MTSVLDPMSKLSSSIMFSVGVINRNRCVCAYVVKSSPTGSKMVRRLVSSLKQCFQIKNLHSSIRFLSFSFVCSFISERATTESDSISRYRNQCLIVIFNPSFIAVFLQRGLMNMVCAYKTSKTICRYSL